MLDRIDCSAYLLFDLANDSVESLSPTSKSGAFQ